jgi:nucleolar protein 12
MAKLRALKKIGDRPTPSKPSAPTKGQPDPANKRERRMSSATSPGRASKPRAPRIDLGERLASLSKEERKAIKATDEDRIQRRLEKKKMKTAQGGDGLNEEGKVDLGRAKKKDGPVVGKKTRVRSDRNEIRKNTKK